MPRIRYQVAMSLDGYIAGPNGEYDWIIPAPDIDFEALYAQFDTFLMGRKTYEVAGAAVGSDSSDKKVIIFSRSLQPRDHPGVTIVREVTEAAVASIRAQAAKDIWLFGGGSLFRSFLEAGFVDTVEIAVIPVLLGGGIPLLESPSRRASLSLTRHRVYKSGIALLEYDVQPE